MCLRSADTAAAEPLPRPPKDEGREVDGKERSLEVSGEERFFIGADCEEILPMCKNNNRKLMIECLELAS